MPKYLNPILGPYLALVISSEQSRDFLPFSKYLLELYILVPPPGVSNTYSLKDDKKSFQQNYLLKIYILGMNYY